VTVLRDPVGQQQLAGYVRVRPGAQVNGADLRQQVAQRLPGYMVPGYLTVVDEFPLSASGKIDKAALPAPEAQDADHVAPATLIETVLVDLYATTLGREQAGATDSFFDIGGNSFLAMQLTMQMEEQFDVEIDVSAVFLAPSPRQLAALLRDKHGFEDTELGDDGIDGLEPLADLG
jgi:acyl carrier protein